MAVVRLTEILAIANQKHLIAGMPNEPDTIALIADADRFTVCIEYVLQLFAKTHAWDMPSGPPAQNLYKAAIYYGEPAAKPQMPAVVIPRSDFFSTSFGKNSDAPEGFSSAVASAKGSAFKSQVQAEGAVAHLNFDLIASAFYLLSGYHDWVCKTRDDSGRTLSTHVEVPSETWDLPIVNHWFRQLDELLRQLTGTSQAANAPLFPTNQTVCLTHDVDLLKKYRLTQLPRHLLRSKKTGRAGAEFARARAVLSGKQRDPYESFDQLYTVKERIGAPSTFFFMGSKPSARNSDYRVSEREARGLLVRARSSGDEIALHGSWESAENGSLIKPEKAAVEQASGQKVSGSRQHYLRFNTSASWRALSEAGIRYDSTGGFPDRCGFKYGWSGCFHPFDLERMESLPILEIPLVCMDVTLAAYEKIPAELALERLTNLLDAATERVNGGAFVFLWHNTMGDKISYPGYWDTFEYFFSVASGSARFITMNQLCDEFEGLTS